MFLRRTLAALAVVFAASSAAAQSAQVEALIAEGDRLSAEAVRQTATALLKYQEADRLAAGIPDVRLRASAKLNVVRGLYNNDAQTQCLSTGTEVEALARSIGAQDILGNLYRVTGACLLALGRFDEADTTFADAARILQTHGTSTQYALALSNRAANARLQGRLGHSIGIGRQAIGVVDQAIAAGEELTPRVHFAVPFNLGKAIADSGDYLGARPYLERAFSAAERYNDIGGQMHALFDTGEWYESQGDADKAARYYRRSLDYTRTQQNGHELEGRSLEALGRLAVGRGESAEAVTYLSDALRLYEAKELHLHLSTTLVLLARARGAHGDLQGAERDLTRAVSLSRDQKQSIGIVLALIERGRQRAGAGALSGARRDLDDAIAEAGRERLLPLIPSALASRAAVEEAAGHLDDALALYEKAADALDRIRGHIVSFDLRITFASATHQVFSGLVRVLERLHRDRPEDGFERRALMALERERSHSLELDTGLARELADPGASGAEVRIAQIQSALFAPDLSEARRQQLLTSLDDAERNLSLRTAAPQPGVRRAVPLADLQASLEDDEVLIEYAADETRLSAFVVTRAELRLVRLNPGPRLADRVSFFIRSLESNARDAAITSGRILAAELIEPLQLAQTSVRLLIVAAGALARLPFAALPMTAREGEVEPLMVRHQLSYLPSLTLFEQRRLANFGALERRMLAVADAVPPAGETRGLPALPASRIEAAAVSRHAASTLLIGKDATERALKREAKAGYPIWHLATHAILDAAVPERSAVVLGESDGDDGLLQAREIYQMPMEGALVVLSGCHTANGQASGAEGLRSLSRAFLHAGGRAVVGSLWELPDAGAADLMMSFYRELEKGRDAGDAMTLAQRRAGGADPYSSSRTWAALVIMGDPAVTFAARPRNDAVVYVLAVMMGMMALTMGWLAVARRATRN